MYVLLCQVFVKVNEVRSIVIVFILHRIYSCERFKKKYDIDYVRYVDEVSMQIVSHSMWSVFTSICQFLVDSGCDQEQESIHPPHSGKLSPNPHSLV